MSVAQSHTRCNALVKVLDTFDGIVACGVAQELHAIATGRPQRLAPRGVPLFTWRNVT